MVVSIRNGRIWNIRWTTKAIVRTNWRMRNRIHTWRDDGYCILWWWLKHGSWVFWWTKFLIYDCRHRRSGIEWMQCGRIRLSTSCWARPRRVYLRVFFKQKNENVFVWLSIYLKLCLWLYDEGDERKQFYLISMWIINIFFVDCVQQRWVIVCQWTWSNQIFFHD